MERSKTLPSFSFRLIVNFNDVIPKVTEIIQYILLRLPDQKPSIVAALATEVYRYAAG